MELTKEQLNSAEGVKLGAMSFYQNDLLSIVSEVYNGLHDLLFKRRGSSKQLNILSFNVKLRLFVLISAHYYTTVSVYHSINVTK